eukprot:5533828-Pyramimonas_sp.AAC.1
MGIRRNRPTFAEMQGFKRLWSGRQYFAKYDVAWPVDGKQWQQGLNGEDQSHSECEKREVKLEPYPYGHSFGSSACDKEGRAQRNQLL